MIVEDSNGLWTERSPIVQQSWDEHRALEVPQTQARKARKQGGTDCNRDTNQPMKICSRTTRVNVDSGSLWGTKGCTVLPRVGAEARRQWGCEPCTLHCAPLHCCTVHCCEPSNASLLLHVTLTLSKTLPPPSLQLPLYTSTAHCTLAEITLCTIYL